MPRMSHVRDKIPRSVYDIGEGVDVPVALSNRDISMILGPIFVREALVASILNRAAAFGLVKDEAAENVLPTTAEQFEAYNQNVLCGTSSETLVHRMDVMKLFDYDLISLQIVDAGHYANSEVIWQQAVETHHPLFMSVWQRATYKGCGVEVFNKSMIAKINQLEHKPTMPYNKHIALLSLFGLYNNQKWTACGDTFCAINDLQHVRLQTSNNCFTDKDVFDNEYVVRLKRYKVEIVNDIPLVKPTANRWARKNGGGTNKNNNSDNNNNASGNTNYNDREASRGVMVHGGQISKNVAGANTNHGSDIDNTRLKTGGNFDETLIKDSRTTASTNEVMPADTVHVDATTIDRIKRFAEKREKGKTDRTYADASANKVLSGTTYKQVREAAKAKELAEPPKVEIKTFADLAAAVKDEEIFRKPNKIVYVGGVTANWTNEKERQLCRITQGGVRLLEVARRVQNGIIDMDIPGPTYLTTHTLFKPVWERVKELSKPKSHSMMLASIALAITTQVEADYFRCETEALFWTVDITNKGVITTLKVSKEFDTMQDVQLNAFTYWNDDPGVWTKHLNTADVNWLVECSEVDRVVMIKLRKQKADNGKNKK
jgi:hypothetical protein